MPSLISGSAAEMGDIAIKLASHQLSFYYVLSLSEDSQLQSLEEVTRQGSSVLCYKDSVYAYTILYIQSWFKVAFYFIVK